MAEDRYHMVVWSQERVARFWDFFAKNSASNPVCFSQDHARALLRLAQPFLARNAPVLDLGCGPGFLLEALAHAGYDVGGLDPSPDAVRAATERIAHYPHTLGLHVGRLERLPFSDGSAGTLFLVEVLEHLDDETLTACWVEMRRVLRPGGTLILTVPHAENLAARLVACPECGCIFHRVQHLRAFDAASLRAMMERYRFAPLRVEPINLINYGGSGPLRLLGLARRILDRVLNRPRVNLLAVGRSEIS